MHSIIMAGAISGVFLFLGSLCVGQEGTFGYGYQLCEYGTLVGSSFDCACNFCDVEGCTQFILPDCQNYTDDASQNTWFCNNSGNCISCSPANPTGGCSWTYHYWGCSLPLGFGTPVQNTTTQYGNLVPTVTMVGCGS